MRLPLPPRSELPSKTIRSRCLRRAVPAALAAILAALSFAVPAPPPAAASDETGFKAIETQWKKLTKNHDDAATRERRKLILQSFDFRELKSCRKFLREAWAEENDADNRCAVVQVLGATGDPKDLEFLLGAFKKEKAAGPQIALGLGLSFTDAAGAPAVSAWAAGQLGKLRGEPLRSTLEGLGALGDPAAYPALVALGDKLEKPAAFERVVALGACGREQAMAFLERESASLDADLRLAAALGLAETGGPGQPPAAGALASLMTLLADLDPRVVEAAAEALAKTKHEPAVKPLAEALRKSPLRQREALRAALKAITGREAGHDADLWLKQGGAAPAPKLATFGKASLASDRLAVLLDTSKSMEWQGRLDEARSLVTRTLAALPDDTQFAVVGVGRTAIPQTERLVSGPAAKAAAGEWMQKILTAWGTDVEAALAHVASSWPSVDTVIFATDSAPRGASADRTPIEVTQAFRRANRIRRLRVFVAFTAPAGRYVTSELDAGEYEDRKDLLKQFAEMTGAEFQAFE